MTLKYTIRRSHVARSPLRLGGEAGPLLRSAYCRNSGAAVAARDDGVLEASVMAGAHLPRGRVTGDWRCEGSVPEGGLCPSCAQISDTANRAFTREGSLLLFTAAFFVFIC